MVGSKVKPATPFLLPDAVYRTAQLRVCVETREGSNSLGPTGPIQKMMTS